MPKINDLDIPEGKRTLKYRFFQHPDHTYTYILYSIPQRPHLEELLFYTGKKSGYDNFNTELMQVLGKKKGPPSGGLICAGQIDT